MIVLFTLRIFAFDTGACSGFFTDEAFMFVTFFLNVLNAPYIDDPILFLEVTFRHPNRANVMDPNIMTARLICRVCRFIKVVIVKFFFILLISIFAQDLLGGNILLLLFIVRTSL
jgi:hypothetical protein